MKTFVSLVLYIALTVGAIAGTAEIDALRDGDMKKLNLHSTPKSAAEIAFQDESGGEKSLADYQGKYVLVNFWATWCAPCRKEMPSLSALQAEFAGDRFEVVTIASGRNPPAAMEKFMSEAGIENLPLYRDPKMGLSRAMGVLGLPISVILNPEGQEIARLQGDADWHSVSARAIIGALIAE